MLDPDSPLPLYHQLKAAIRHEIRLGHWLHGTVIPPERELIARFGVSRTTVRQALGELVAEGILYRQQGKGTFVAVPRPIVETLSGLTGHVEELHLRGLSPQVTVLEVAVAAPPDSIAAMLELEPDEPAQVIRRLVAVDGEPLLTMTAWLPLRLGLTVTKADLRDASIYRLLETHGVYPTHGRQRIKATVASAAEAGVLQVDAGQPLLEVTRTVFTAGDKPVEWSRALYRPDRYEYIVELRRRRVPL